MKPVEPASWGWLNWLHGDWSRLNRLHEASLTGFMGFEAGCRPSYDCKGFLGFPITPKICIYCFLMIYAFTGINFDIQHAYIPSQLAKWHFRGPYRPLRALVKGLRVKKKHFASNMLCIHTIHPSMQKISHFCWELRSGFPKKLNWPPHTLKIPAPFIGIFLKKMASSFPL